MKTALQAGSLALICLALALSSVLAGPLSVAAQAPAEDARALFARGQTAYRQGDYDAAIAAWTTAYSQDPRPLLQYNLAQAYERLGRLPEAQTALEKYVAEAEPNDPNQGDARARLSSLRERLSRTGVRIMGGPEGATILIDGEDKGRTPRPDAISVSPGSHRIVIRLAGYSDFNSTLVVPAGSAVDLAVEMTAAAPGGGGGGGRSAGGGGGEAPPPSGDSSLPLILVIGGGAVTAIGLVVGIVAFTKAGNAVSSDGPEAAGARRLALVADISMGVGIIAAGIGLVMMLTSGGDDDVPPPSATARLQIAPILAPTVAGASATLTF